MNSESFADHNNQDQMAHYAYPEQLSSPTSHTNGNHHSPTNNLQTKNGKTTNVSRIGTRSRTGARVGNPNYSLSSPEGKEIEKEILPATTATTGKGRGKRARTEKKEKEVPTSEGEQISLVSSRFQIFIYLKKIVLTRFVLGEQFFKA